MIPTANGTMHPHQGPNRPATPPRIIVLGFYDGPTEGVIQFGDRGPVFQFTMPDEDRQLASQSDQREYAFQPLPPDALDRLAVTLARYLPPSWPVWIPLWRFPSPEVEQSISETIDAILAAAGPPQWRVKTSSYQTFEEFQAERIAVEQTA
jgi:hypothetical protein